MGESGPPLNSNKHLLLIACSLPGAGLSAGEKAMKKTYTTCPCPCEIMILWRRERP